MPLNNSKVSTFKAFRLNISSIKTKTYYMETCKVSEDGELCEWDSTSIGVNDDIFVTNPFWSKAVSLTDDLLYLIGGSEVAKTFLEKTAKVPKASISLIGLNQHFGYVHD